MRVPSVRLLEGVESRLQTPVDDSPDAELRRGLVPKLPALSELPRIQLEEDKEMHRRDCEVREARWDEELAETLTVAEEVRLLVAFPACCSCSDLSWGSFPATKFTPLSEVVGSLNSPLASQ